MLMETQRVGTWKEGRKQQKGTKSTEGVGGRGQHSREGLQWVTGAGRLTPHVLNGQQEPVCLQDPESLLKSLKIDLTNATYVILSIVNVKESSTGCPLPDPASEKHSLFHILICLLGFLTKTDWESGW